MARFYADEQFPFPVVKLLRILGDFPNFESKRDE
ncbi:hypothetical protein Glo7428_0698 [Gloeocapsa sp. PCC 7428]|nr:hypothetical protein Glo7428_0698 [Gloeocapsa sp. PCC 7428]